MSTSRPVALVTGASSGIGLELARVLGREGHDLVLVARREAELQALATELSARYGATATVLSVDLATPTAAREVLAATTDRDLEVDVLVNNAGFGGSGRFTTTDAGHEDRMLAVNIVALTHLTKVYLPGMVARGHGRVLNVASTAAFQAGPFMAVYYASKAYVLSFTEALAEELSGTGVTATALCPGFVPSGFGDVAGTSDSLIARSPAVKSAVFVAEAGYDGMVRGRRVVIPGVVNKIGVQGLRVSPRRAVAQIVRRLHPPE